MEKSKLKTIVAFEGDEIVENIGESDAKMDFLQSHDVFVKFNSGKTVFYSAGVYQVFGGPPIIILPWFLKNSTSEEKLQGRDVLEFFDSLKEIKYFVDSLSEINTDGLENNVKEIVFHSFLKRMNDSLINLLKRNHFSEHHEKINVIKGKWNAASDLALTSKPLSFNCTYTDLGYQVVEVEFSKAVCVFLKHILRSRKNKHILESIFKLLDDVKSPLLTALELSRYEERFKFSNISLEWKFYLEFIKEFLFQSDFKSPLAGISYRFKLDSFFEDVIQKILSYSEGDITLQKREDILGGSRWRSSDGTFFENDDLTKKAVNKSIPDIVFSRDKYVSIVECKYKPLRAGFTKGDGDKFLKTLSREDRNQILSFVLSIRPDTEYRNKTIVFNVTYPSYHVDDVEFSTLEFPFASFSLDSGIKKVFQKRGVQGTEYTASLKVNFVAINIKNFLRSIKSNTVKEFSDKFVNAVTSQEIRKETILKPKSAPQKQFMRRLALSSVIVDQLHDDPEFGRVKLAKVFYLTDVFLNLNLEENYYRQAAGPVNIKSLVDERVGVETFARKNSIYDSVPTPRKENLQVKYIPLRNLEEYLKQARIEFDGQLDEIYRIINFFKPLSYEQSEIVSTLFACWNDLLIENKGQLIADSSIIDEFLYRWHKSKERFEDRRDVLTIWLTRMKEKKLVPDGGGVRTIKLSA